MEMKLKAAVIGGSGYTGLELLKLLNNHSAANVYLATSKTYEGMKIDEVFPSFNDFTPDNYNDENFTDIKKSENITAGRKSGTNLKFVSPEKISSYELDKIDVIFLCLPPLESMEFIRNNLMDFNGKIIDIGSDFRIRDPENFKTWYGTEHKLKNMLPDFIYGLPEIYKEMIAKSRLIANPGCYPTSILLALAPLLKNESLTVRDINIDSKSGVSGAGRKLKPEYLFCNINENFFAYSVLLHRHIGEIEQEIEKLANKNFKISFTPHLLPINRGIFTSVYCKIEAISEGLKYEKDLLGNMDILSLITKSYEDFYKDAIFVKFLGQKIPQLKDVVGTNVCQIGIALDERTGILKIFSVLDNLLKGAAGQAVQNMNIAFGLNEAEGLKGYGIFS
jgi:N-acetyl-gamma-glutamyl-phosphate reductase